MKKQTTIELLKSQLPGFYSVEQVIELIDGIEEESSNKISMETMQVLKKELVRSIVDELDSLSQDEVVDYSSAEFSICSIALGGNQIQLDSIDWARPNPFENTVDTAVSEILHDFFEPKED